MLESLKNVALTGLNFFFASKARLVLFLVLLFTPILMLTKIIKDHHPSSFTVMVTNLEETSGGSGSIIWTSSDKSLVLTNAHVCDVLNKRGGIVKKEDGSKYMAYGYRKSNLHDLCAISVAADLGSTIALADHAPVMYSEAIVTGHPALLPNVINKGAFGDRKIIEVLTGFRPCSPKDYESEENAFYCIFAGGVPIITTYESLTVSAIIMGGSSGSAVLNDQGDLSGVVFAGSGKGLSYAYIVPYEYVSTFIKKELTNEAEFVKVPLVGGDVERQEKTQKAKRNLYTECSREKPTYKACLILEQDLGLRGLKE